MLNLLVRYVEEASDMKLQNQSQYLYREEKYLKGFASVAKTNRAVNSKKGAVFIYTHGPNWQKCQGSC